MATVHEDAAMFGFREFMSTEDGAKALQVYFEGLKEDRWEADYVSAIGQHAWFESARWPVEQVYAFMMVHHMVMEGEIAEVRIGVGDSPSADRDREANQCALNDLPGPFVATVDFDQKSSDFGDGTLEWTEPIKVTQSTGVPYTDPHDGRIAPLTMVRMMPPGHVPLEIGTTCASKTLEHVERLSGLARWPYGSDHIRLFVRTRPPRSVL